MCHRRKHKKLDSHPFFFRHFSTKQQTVGNYSFLCPLLESTLFLRYSLTDFYIRFLNLVLIIILSDHIKMKISVRHNVNIYLLNRII